MNERVKNILRGITIVLVLALIVFTVRGVEVSKQNKRKANQTRAFATGGKVKIGTHTWTVRTYNAANGKCYKIHIRGGLAFAIPCN